MNGETPGAPPAPDAMRPQPSPAAVEAGRRWAEEQERRTDLLAEAGVLLSASLDYVTTLRNLARLAVPRLADWCAIDVVGADGAPERVVTAHPDPARERLAVELAERYPPDRDAARGVLHVLRTGEPELVPEIPEALLRASAVDEEHLRLLLSLGLCSYMVVPLRARGRILGAISLVFAESGRRYDAQDLRFAEELAGRAALAVDNALLYGEAERARAQTARLLESITDAFFALDAEWRFSYLNDEATRLLGRSREALLGRSVWEEFPEAVDSTFWEMYHTAVREQRTTEFEEFFAPLETWFEVRAYPTGEGLSVFFRNVNERKRAAEALRHQSELTRTITDNATAALFMMDARGHCTYMNPAAEQMTGYSLAEVRDVPLHDAIHHHHPDGRPYPLQECPIDRALPEDFSIRAHEDIFIRKDGSFFPVLVAASPVFRGGVPVSTVVEVRDVTEERRAEQALRDSERRFRFLADAIPVHVWTARPDGALDYVSRETARYFGQPEQSILEDGWLGVLHPDQVAEVTRRWQHALRTGEPYEVELQLRNAAGQYRWHLGRAVAQRADDGTITGWFGSNTDIHDRKEAEQERERLIRELDVERGRLREIFRDAPAAIATLRGPEHVFESANPGYLQLVGHRAVVGRSVAEALPEITEQGFIELLDTVRRTGRPFVGNEVRVMIQRQPGGEPEESFLNFVYQPMRDADGAVAGVFVHAVEVTDQVRARQEVERKAEELLRLTRQLEASNRELDQFAYVASHDLKAPLRGIANLSQWIEEDLEGEMAPEVREHMDLLRGRVQRMEGLIDGILQYSRAGRVRERPEPVDVRALLDEVVDLLAPPPGATIDIGDPMPELVTERLPLQQVFLNLIGNALKHNPGPDARVRVEAREESGAFRFTVADNGPGIAPEYHDRIFGIFQTLRARDEVEGTGIGLSLVKKFVEQRGGRVWVESAVGGGAAFHFLWPRHTPAED